MLRYLFAAVAGLLLLPILSSAQCLTTPYSQPTIRSTCTILVECT
jgi:hypothetical protein